MARVEVRNNANANVGSVDLPQQFTENVRPDLIKKAVEAIWSHRRQPYGADPRAGKKHAAKLSRRRRDYKTAYGIGISRVPRKIMSRRGTRFNWVGAFAPGMVGGRRAHPPTAMKQWDKKINVKERRKAICSALAASMTKDWITRRGHRVPAAFPFVLDHTIEELGKTKEVEALLEKLGFGEELRRIHQIKIRAGKGKMRGRRYVTKKGPLFVVGKNCPLAKSARNIPGVEVCVIDQINAELLAPGADPGRLTLYSASAIERLAKEGLFTSTYQGPQQQKEVPKQEAPKQEKKVTEAKPVEKKTAKPKKAAKK